MSGIGDHTLAGIPTYRDVEAEMQRASRYK
jgi:hypothetical protein